MTNPSRVPRAVFAHGSDSAPWGTKITRLAAVAKARGFTVESPDQQSIDAATERAAHLERLAPTGAPLVLIGSSMGGFVAASACAALAPAALFLMAPAFYMEGFPGDPQACPADTEIIHGWADDVVPASVSIDFARPRRARLHLVDDGHPLADNLDFIAACFDAQLDRILTPSRGNRNSQR